MIQMFGETLAYHILKLHSCLIIKLVKDTIPSMNLDDLLFVPAEASNHIIKIYIGSDGYEQIVCWCLHMIQIPFFIRVHNFFLFSVDVLLIKQSLRLVKYHMTLFFFFFELRILAK